MAVDGEMREFCGWMSVLLPSTFGFLLQGTKHPGCRALVPRPADASRLTCVSAGIGSLFFVVKCHVPLTLPLVLPRGKSTGAPGAGHARQKPPGQAVCMEAGQVCQAEAKQNSGPLKSQEPVSSGLE